jgi:ABC-type sugar transport system ATPase subunit
VREPRVYLMDEPLSNLDAKLRVQMRGELKRLQHELGTTTVYVTHDQAEAMVTSDRIAVMNLGRIEQVADPHTLYNRPKTRFVAGFIGRTNFIEGNSANGHIEFGSFALPALEGAPASGKVTISVRPQSMHLSRAQSANGQPQVAVTIAERAYLGEFWDYVVTPADSGMKLRVTTPPLEIFQVGESAWLAFDPKQITPIS